MKNEKKYKIYYGDNENDYIKRYLRDDEIINGFLSEAKAFDLFYSSMIMCNNYLQENDFSNINELISAYNENDDYYCDEFQVFIIEPEYDEEITIKATTKMGNTLYYDNKLDLYLTGITDLGTSRRLVPTDLEVVADEQ